MEESKRFEYNKLRGKIREVCGTQDEFGKAIGMSHMVLVNRLNGKTNFRQDEILAACNVLRIPQREIPAYFFTLKG